MNVRGMLVVRISPLRDWDGVWTSWLGNAGNAYVVIQRARSHVKRLPPCVPYGSGCGGHSECVPAHETDREDAPPWGAAVARLDPLDQEVGGRSAHLRERLPDRGQAEAFPAGHVDVVEADDRQLGGNPDADAPGRIERPERDHVIRGEHRRRSRLGCEQVEAPLVAARVAELADTPQGLVELDARCVELLAEAALAVPARRRVLGPGDE